MKITAVFRSVILKAKKVVQLFIMRISAPHLLLDARADLGEGPAWDASHQRLYWVDILPGRLHIYHPDQNLDETIQLGQMLGCVAPARSGKLLLGLKDNLAVLTLPSVIDASFTPQPVTLAQPEAHLPGNRFNDGKCAPDGRFLAGTMDMAEKDASGALYSLSPDGILQTLRSGVRISNGLTWSPDQRTMYYIDTPTREVLAFDYDGSTGQIANPRVVVTIPPQLGWPDGMTSDSAGRLWICLWGGAALTVWNPADGNLLETVKFPAKNVTACAFGGPGLDQLYVTSARTGLGEADLTAYPASGGLFRLETNVTGSPTFFFAD